MGITGVGSSYNFVYNTKTGKLSTKDGSKNEFVDFCNGDVKGEDTETLNHFDEHTRYSNIHQVCVLLSQAKSFHPAIRYPLLNYKQYNMLL